MVKLDKNYYLSADSNCYILYTKTEKKDKNGNDVYMNEGYYNTIESALQGLMKKELRKYISKKNIQTMEELLTEVKRLEEYIKSLKIDI